ncbi:MAG: hypothetical protein JXR59_03210 [Desulfuromonadaceae bacterium]|nr:hypothetical protein [Desulfuromonadaceae bacterium]
MSFRIRKGFLFPLGLLTLEIVALLVSCIVFHEPIGKCIILSTLVLPVLILFLECLFRQTVLTEQGIETRKLLRRKQLNFTDLTAVETIQVKKRAFVTLCAGDEFLIVSNAYANFPLLIDGLLQRVPAAVVSEETAQMATNPPRKSSDIVSCWAAAALLAFLLYAQLKSGLPLLTQP